MKDNSIIANWVIYKITSPSGRIYIGKTSRFEKRKYYYKHCNQKRQPHIYHSLKKYGYESHVIEIVEEFKGDVNLSNEREIYWINFYKSNYRKYPENRGMNMTDGGEGMLGVKLSPESIEKVKKWRRENKFRTTLGQKKTEEHKRKISESKKGKSCSPATQFKKGHISPFKGTKGVRKAWNKGKKFEGTDEERKIRFGKHSIGNTHRRGKKLTKEQIDAIRERVAGKPKPAKRRPIFQYDLNGFFIKQYQSVDDAIKESGVPKTTFYRMLKGVHRHKYKYSFTYKKDIVFQKFTFKRRIFNQQDIKYKAA